jgi:hypothetical protein
MTDRPLTVVEVQAAVRRLVGLPLNSSVRAADLEMFDFGRIRAWVDKHGRDRTSGDVSLHVQGPWRIVDGDRIIVGYYDMRDPPAGVPRDGWDPSEARATHRDELLGAYFLDRMNPRIVAAATAQPSGDLRIDLDDGTALEILPMSTADDDEFWRLFDRDGPHLVVGASGMRRVGD